MSDTRLRLLHANGRDMPDGLFGYTMRPAQQPEQPDTDRAHPGDITALCEALRGHGGMTREELAAKLGWSERKVRDVSECSQRVVSAPGVKGFYLASEVTVTQWATMFLPKWRAYQKAIDDKVSALTRAVHGNIPENTSCTPAGDMR